MLDTNSGAFPVCCENIDKRAPGPIALPIQTAPDPLIFTSNMALHDSHWLYLTLNLGTSECPKVLYEIDHLE